ncbi:hypothetical protein TorRG33x02_241930 [Trema orientale]|uniref:Uncharacterized protein n=1 Tax=Trema orientale TaxID=63057 RepID=A0A2P5DTY8_TREOI|nr:hypothetical protein TorRG33x02_241930 [Trema orientale]
MSVFERSIFRSVSVARVFHGRNLEKYDQGLISAFPVEMQLNLFCPQLAATATTTFARTLAGLSSSSEELSSIYGSRTQKSSGRTRRRLL